MGGAASVNQSIEGLVEAGLLLYENDPEKFDTVITKVKNQAMHTRPLFPENIDIAKIPSIPADEIATFKAKYISDSYLDHDDPEAIARMKPAQNIRNIQYARWRWACKNIDIFVNSLRLSGYSDERIDAMLKGTPFCFSSRAMFQELQQSLSMLQKELESQMAWKDIAFVVTGSSVAGFSQNPQKGFRDIASKITSINKSDVDICIVADGFNYWVAEMKIAEAPEPKRLYTTTSCIQRSNLRYGCKDLSLLCPAVLDFFNTWKEKFNGGLQLTFCEAPCEIPPWEMQILC